MATGFHHVTLVSADARRTVRFYRDVLGLGLVKRTVNFDDPASYHLYFGDANGRPGTLLTFFEWAGAGRGRWGVGGVHHVALVVASEDAQLKWKRRLEDAGVAVTGPYDRGWFHSIYFTDRDGQILEIATTGPGYDVDEPSDRLGVDVIQPKPSQLRGGRDDAAIRARTWPEPVPEITPDMALGGIHHVTGLTEDVARMGEFYEAALGLRLVKKSVNQDDGRTPHWFWAAYDGQVVAPRSSLTMFDWKGSTLRAREGAGQTHHIAFRVADDEGLAAARERLLSLGVDVTEILDQRYFRSVAFTAPDGQLMEIATDGPGFGIDEGAAELGTALQLPAWLEPRRDELAAALPVLP